ncbi:hypothetical protein H744_2c0447 [Photobacterium gaetbulicola Gung47]|uniref:Uncharacterized protein n=1 Tax=Photobacterium gaetbulicola Gung47 TaxID=658445 RepID=A0A0C5WJ61_9GAMM|nr:hypothetical protein H744_2c0447 [Photobacterium gaetbulicola Gung47]
MPHTLGLSVADTVDEPFFFARWRIDFDVVIDFFFQQRPGHGGVNRNIVVAAVDLIRADNAERFGFAFVVLDFDPGTEEHLAVLLR